VAAKARPKLEREKNLQLFWANLGPLPKVKLLGRVLGDYQRFAKSFTRFSFHAFHFFLSKLQETLKEISSACPWSNMRNAFQMFVPTGDRLNLKPYPHSLWYHLLKKLRAKRKSDD